MMRKIPSRWVVALIAVALIGGYALTVAYPLIEGPSLRLDELSIAPDGIVAISGSTERVSRLTLNDLEIPVTVDGAFGVERSYPPGYTVLVLRASDRFGRTREETRAFTINPTPYGTPEETSSDGRGQPAEEPELDRD